MAAWLNLDRADGTRCTVLRESVVLRQLLDIVATQLFQRSTVPLVVPARYKGGSNSQ